MMQFFYQLSLLTYSFLIQLFAPFHKKAKLLRKGHQNLLPRLQKAFDNNQEKVAWFHTASLGEFEQARPVIEKYKITYLTEKEKYLIVFDDILSMTPKHMTREGRWWNSYISQYRHRPNEGQVSLMFFLQYFKDLSPVIRSNLSYLGFD